VSEKPFCIYTSSAQFLVLDKLVILLQSAVTKSFIIYHCITYAFFVVIIKQHVALILLHFGSDCQLVLLSILFFVPLLVHKKSVY